MNNNQDLFSRLGDSQGNLGEDALGGGDPFNDSGKDFFEKFMDDDFDRSNRSAGLTDGHLMLSANDRQFQEMLGTALEKGADALMSGGESMATQLLTTQQQQQQSNINRFPFAGQVAMSSNQGFGQNPGSSNANWFNGSSTITAPVMMNGNMLDAAPLNVSLGGGLESRNVRAGLAMSNIEVATGNSNTSLSSMMRRKGSNTQMHQAKMGSVRKVGLTSSKLRSAKSEGMLARALKAKYNSGNSLNKYNINAAEASAVVNSRMPRSSMSASAAGSVGGLTQRLSQSNIFGDDKDDQSSVATTREGRAVGGRNASWGAEAAQKHGASMFANILQHSGSSNQHEVQSVTSSSSMASLMRQQKAAGGGSRTSMQDLLRLSKKQSKTQSALRQSSAQSLLKQTSSQSLKGPNEKVDLSNLLPPNHAMMGLSISAHIPSPKVGESQQNAKMGSPQSNSMDGSSLLHQSCRLYPKTTAVVESALRIEPNAVRTAVPVATEKGQSKKGYGYPVNLAMTHGGSLEVIKMLIDAGPDVLVQKDGTDGSGSLSIALSNNVEPKAIDMLLQANPECAKVADRRGNYPLHVAVNNGLSFQIVKRLHTIYPKALQMRNFHSQTPLDIAQQSTRCSEEVMNFLQSSAFSPLDVHHLDQHNRADLEDGLDDIMETNF